MNKFFNIILSSISVTEVHLTKKSYNQINVTPRCSDFLITTTYFTTYYNLELYLFIPSLVFIQV